MTNNPLQSNDIYERLGVEKDSSAQIIHKHFLKLVSDLLLMIKNDQSSQLLENLRSLWVAHDILVDPNCRTDYDLRSLGISTTDVEMDSQTGSITFASGKQPKTSSWRIGELLQAVGILEQAELDIACDMHRAMPEMQFGRFLIKQDFLNETQLHAILIGQTLIRAGVLTLSQFLAIMTESTKSNRNIKEVLLESGLLKNPTEFKLDFDL